MVLVTHDPGIGACAGRIMRLRDRLIDMVPQETRYEQPMTLA